MLKNNKVRFRYLILAILVLLNVVIVGHSTPVYAAPSGSWIHGVNWADPRDNYAMDNLVPTGLNVNDNYATTYSKASSIIDKFKSTGANTIRMPVNPNTTSGWWNTYKAAIQCALDKGMSVILCAWYTPYEYSGTTSFFSMWDTIVNTYGNYSNNGAYVMYELMNEPGQSWSESTIYTNYAQWMSRYSSIEQWRVILDGPGGPTMNIYGLANDSRFNNCLLALHTYSSTCAGWNWSTFGWQTNSDENYWSNKLLSDLQGQGSRVVVTEYGNFSHDARNYNSQANGDTNVAFIRGTTNRMHDSGIGNIYWSANRLNDDFNLLDANNLSVCNQSLLDRVNYAWGIGSTSVSNYIKNSSFDGDSTSSQTPSNWLEWNNVNNSYTDNYGGAHAGNYYLAHYSSSNFEVSTYQDNSIPAGTYTLSAWVKKDGTFTGCNMIARNLADSSVINTISLTNNNYGSWTQISFQFTVSSTTNLRLEFWSKANAGAYFNVDDVSLTKN